jgi:rubredoxin
MIAYKGRSSISTGAFLRIPGLISPLLKKLLLSNSEWYNDNENQPLLNTRKENTMKYECEVCGYVYDPAVGDEENGIAPGTAFEDLPDGWECPLCSAGKDEFKPAE